tara:strand:- start:303 stop:503 length:201 start_codon:yes stop_codon:yes gene_type:complete
LTTIKSISDAEYTRDTKYCHMITKDTLIEIKTLLRVAEKLLIKSGDFALKAIIIGCIKGSRKVNLL